MDPRTQADIERIEDERDLWLLDHPQAWNEFTEKTPEMRRVCFAELAERGTLETMEIIVFFKTMEATHLANENSLIHGPKHLLLERRFRAMLAQRELDRLIAIYELACVQHESTIFKPTTMPAQ